jgi:hypothetical protein
MLKITDMRESLIAPVNGRGYFIHDNETGGIFQVLFGDTRACYSVILINKLTEPRTDEEECLRWRLVNKSVFSICTELCSQGNVRYTLVEATMEEAEEEYRYFLENRFYWEKDEDSD